MGNNRLQLEPEHIATAPYNFVSLPNFVVPSPLDQGLDWEEEDQETVHDFYQDYLASNEVFDGILHLTITTKTPCFIGGSGEKSFAPVNPDEPIIPGSTLRGMVKNLLKIITCGTLRADGKVEEDFHDRRMYFRSMAATVKSFKTYYENQLGIKNFSDGKKHYSISGALAGFLVSRDSKYYICPASCPEQKDRPLLHDSKVNEVAWHMTEGKCECYTGAMGSKKHYDVVFDGNWDQPKEIPEAVIKAYKEDKKRGNAEGKEERDNGFDLFTRAKKGTEAASFTAGQFDTVVPCFYRIDKEGNIQHFGFGRYYRVPYNLSVKDHIPEELQQHIIDFADAIFGKKELWASRVFFDDAFLTTEHRCFPAEYSHPLMSPNPTSFQLYLKQQAGKEPAHWDVKGVPIRGYKLYWHHKETPISWQIGADEKEIPGMIRISPLKQGNVFTGKIRFSQLTAVELGALLKVFALGNVDKELCYKLGQGKSLGMGSVKIDTTLQVFDPSKRYTALFSDSGWETALENADMKPYLDAFDGYLDEVFAAAAAADQKNNIKRKINHRAQYDIIQQELCTMLDWTKRPAPKVTKMMKINDDGKPFQNRWVLPSVCDLFPEEFKE